jgi:hypothetical protein
LKIILMLWPTDWIELTSQKEGDVQMGLKTYLTGACGLSRSTDDRASRSGAR